MFWFSALLSPIPKNVFFARFKMKGICSSPFPTMYLFAWASLSRADRYQANRPIPCEFKASIFPGVRSKTLRPLLIHNQFNDTDLVESLLWLIFSWHWSNMLCSFFHHMYFPPVRWPNKSPNHHLLLQYTSFRTHQWKSLPLPCTRLWCEILLESFGLMMSWWSCLALLRHHSCWLCRRCPVQDGGRQRRSSASLVPSLESHQHHLEGRRQHRRPVVRDWLHAWIQPSIQKWVVEKKKGMGKKKEKSWASFIPTRFVPRSHRPEHHHRGLDHRWPDTAAQRQILGVHQRGLGLRQCDPGGPRWVGTPAVTSHLFSALPAASLCVSSLASRRARPQHLPRVPQPELRADLQWRHQWRQAGDLHLEVGGNRGARRDQHGAAHHQGSAASPSTF